jgi:23S rRNA (pseudouridine1915-N3)-methyltransferase
MINRIVFVSLGKFKSSEYEALFYDYVKRVSRYINTEIKDIKIPKDEPEHIEKIKNKIIDSYKGTKTVVLTERGVNITSRDFADWIQKQEGTVSVIVGSSWGLIKEVEESANLKLSFGKLTFPHEAVRVLSAEQVYRAFTIIKGEGYHK